MSLSTLESSKYGTLTRSSSSSFFFFFFLLNSFVFVFVKTFPLPFIYYCLTKEKNLAPPPIRSHKNAPPQIHTFYLFDFSFHSLRHVGHISLSFFFFSRVRPYPMAIQRTMLYWCENYH